MIVVIHFCTKDVDLAIKNLNWWIYLDGKSDLDCVLSYDDITPANKVAEVEGLASRYFKSVQKFWYPAPVRKTWPHAPNWAWQETARYMAATHSKPWLWMESDGVAIRKGWLTDIAAEHYRAGKPFSGHIVTGMGHCNGLCVYPPIVAQYARDCLHVTEIAWDVVLGGELSRDGDILKFVHPAHTLFQHCWCINPSDGKAWNGSGEVATFKNTHDVIRLVDLTMAIFHRCKDGTLIDMLKLHYEHPELAMVPQNSGQVLPPPNPVSWSKEALEFIHEGQKIYGAEKLPKQDPIDQAIDKLLTGFKENEGSKATSHSESTKADDVRLLAPGVSEGSDIGVRPVEVAKYTGNCEIFIVTYSKDFPWLEYSLRLMQKYCHGFSGITLLVPDVDRDKATALIGQIEQVTPIRLKVFNESHGKGKLHQMIHSCSADLWCPDAEIIVHFDADCMFHTHTTPDEYVRDGKPVMLKRSYEGLYDKESKTWSDCAQWRVPVEKALKFKVEAYTMCRHPSVHPIWIYPELRRWIAKKQGRSFDDFVFDGQNSFPQTFAEYPTIGAYAWGMHRHSYHWIDLDVVPPPRDMQKTYWSWGGITPAIKTEIEGFLK